MSSHSLEEVFKRIEDWEGRLEDSYFMLKEFIDSGRSKQTILVLKRQQEKILLTLEHIPQDGYRKMESIKHLPGENLVPDYEITASTCPREVFEKFLVCEENLEEYYQYLRNLFAATKLKELFDTLIQFKTIQIKEIKNYMDSYALV